MKWFIWYSLFLFSLGCEKPEPAKPQPTPTPVSTPRPTPNDLGIPRGFTIDSIENLPKILNAVNAMPLKPSIRVVCDYPNPASYYKKAIDALALVSVVIIQISDSEYSLKMTVDQFAARTKDYVNTFPQVQIFESPNESNMCSDCSPTKASELVSKQAEASLKIIKDAGRKVMITPYWNLADCVDGNGEYKKWHSKYIKNKELYDYVALSVYGMDCEGRPEPSYAELDKELDAFQVMFPNAKVMIGEYGADAARERKYGIKRLDIMKHYLGYPRVGAGLNWYGYQDLLDINGPMFKEFIK